MVFSISDQWEVGRLKDAACLCKFIFDVPAANLRRLIVCASVRACVKAPLQLHSCASLQMVPLILSGKWNLSRAIFLVH